MPIGPKAVKSVRMEKYKNMGLFIPTLFDFKNMWVSNKNRYNGYFNKLFFWLYPIAGICLIPFTVLCFIEFKMKEQKRYDVMELI